MTQFSRLLDSNQIAKHIICVSYLQPKFTKVNTAECVNVIDSRKCKQ